MIQPIEEPNSRDES